MFNLRYGFFIAIEGPDGAGKTTLISRLNEFLKDYMQNFVTTREPGGTPFAESVRNLLKDNVSKDVNHTSLALLVNAARRDHVETVIMPALSQRALVLTDRYVCTTYTHQHSSVDIDKICELGTVGLMPDLVLMLDIDYNTYTRRILPRVENNELTTEEINHLDIMDSTVFEKRRSGMVYFKNKYPSACEVIDANLLSPDEVFAAAKEIILNRLRDHLI